MTTSKASEAYVAIVTGGSRGIGRSVVRQLAGQGFSVVVGYGSNHDEAAAAVAEAEASGAKALAVSADVADENAVARLFGQAEQAFGGVDVVVNAAGVMSLAPLADKDQELLDRLANAAPLERLGVPNDIAPVVAFLASPEGHWINGQTIRINGGVI